MEFFILMQGYVPAPRLFALDQQTLVQMSWVLLNAVILFFILSKLLYRPVLKALQDRKTRIANEIESAEKSKVEALQLKAEYEQKIKDIAIEKTEILDAARKLAGEKSEEMRVEARSEAETVKNRALREIELEKERAQSEMKKEIIDVSSAIALKFLNKSIDPDVHEQLFNETMAELEELAWHN